MSSRKSQNRNLAAIDRRIDQRIGKGQVITGIAEVVTEDGRAARVRLLGSGVLTDVAVVRGATITPGDHIILLRPTDNDQWVCLGGYVRRVVNTQGLTSLNNITGLSSPNNVRLLRGPGLMFLTWDTPAQRPDLTWLIQSADITDNEWLSPTTYSRGGSTLVVTGVPGAYQKFRIRAIDKNWNRSGWSGIASGSFGATAVGSGSGESGSSTFIDLLDTPSSFSGEAWNYLRVASMENGIEFVGFPNHDHSGNAGDGDTFDAANLTSGAATDGQVLTADGAGGAAWENVATGSGTGIQTYANAWADEPTGAEGDLWIPSDGATLYRYPASGVGHYGGPLFPITPPDNDEFAWINQGSGSVDLGLPPFIYLSDVALAGNNYRIRKKAQPSTPYQLTVGLMPLSFALNYAMFGIGWRESSSGGLALFRIFYGGGWEIQSMYASNPTTDDYTYYGLHLNALPALLWMRLVNDGVNRSFWYGIDGYHFIKFQETTFDSIIEPDEILFFVNSTQNVMPVGMTVVSWKEESLA